MPHTPGPWKAEKPSQVWQINSAAGPIALGVERRKRGHGYDELELQANVRLLASAPDLLGALRYVKHWLDHLENGCSPDDPVRLIRVRVHAPLHQKIDAAIAKAEGSE